MKIQELEREEEEEVLCAIWMVSSSMRLGTVLDIFYPLSVIPCGPECFLVATAVEARARELIRPSVTDYTYCW